MRLDKLFALSPELKANWTQLIDCPTPVYGLSELGRKWGHSELYVKREDLTDFRYGGNKVRNLEFILGHALAQGAENLVTMAPLGSNFVAALAAQSKRVGLKSKVFQFVPERNDQIFTHARFSESQGAELIVSQKSRYPGIAASTLRLAKEWALDSKSYPVAIGGSNWRGALGHLGSALEFAEQIKNGDTPEPDFVVVGAGTCGTVAGLWVGLRLAGLKTKIIGVRCVDRILCNRFRITRLAEEICQRLGLSVKLRDEDLEIVDPIVSGIKDRYAAPIEGARELISLFRETEGLTLDTTYTSKVASVLANRLQTKGARFKIVYWHTFSRAALDWSQNLKTAPLGCLPIRRKPHESTTIFSSSSKA